MKKRVISMMMVLMLLVSISAPVAFAGVPTTFVNLPYATTLNVRAGAGTHYRVVTTVSQDEAIDILKVGSTWTKIQVNRNSIIGYIMNKYIGQLPSENNPLRRGKATAATITGGSVNIRRGPGTRYASLGTKPRDSKVLVWGKRANWYYISVIGGQSGWISKNYVSSTYHTRTTTSVNLRESPNGTILETLERGASVTVIWVDGDWSYVRRGTSLSGPHGFIYSEYLRK